MQSSTRSREFECSFAQPPSAEFPFRRLRTRPQLIPSISRLFPSRSNRPGAVGIQLALMAVVGIVAITAFSLLRPNNSVIYQPKVKYSEDDRRPPKLDKGLLAWWVKGFRMFESCRLTAVLQGPTGPQDEGVGAHVDHRLGRCVLSSLPSHVQEHVR